MSAKERLPPKKFSTTASTASLEENDHDYDDMVMMTIRTITMRVMMTINVITKRTKMTLTRWQFWRSGAKTEREKYTWQRT